jgi:hypothetical protein
MWFQFDPTDDPDAPGSRECHSLDARGDTLFLFGGNDQHQRMNAVVTLNTGGFDCAVVHLCIACGVWLGGVRPGCT